MNGSGVDCWQVTVPVSVKTKKTKERKEKREKKREPREKKSHGRQMTRQTTTNNDGGHGLAHTHTHTHTPESSVDQAYHIIMAYHIYHGTFSSIPSHSIPIQSDLIISGQGGSCGIESMIRRKI